MNTTTHTTKSSKTGGRVALAAVVLTVASLFGLVTAPSASAAPAPRVTLNAAQNTARNALNADRKAHGLPALAPQADAQAKAQAWANKLAAESTIYHSSLPNGIHTKWCSIGENVGYGATVRNIEVAYMNSPHHRDNILNTKWNGVGVGVATNHGITYTVQVFIKTC